MLYCELCGAANDILSSQCHRCGGALSSDDPAVSTAARTPALAQTGAQANQPGPPATNGAPDLAVAREIGQSLDLPDWLKRAAAQTPAAQDGAPEWAAKPPDGFHVVQAVAGPAANDVATGRVSNPVQPLPPVPTADLPTAMPDWLKAQPAPPNGEPTTTAQPIQLTQPIQPAQPAQPIQAAPPAQPERPSLTAPDADAANTATFIAETDLPDWIRQIAAADTAKLAEAEQAAVAAARLAEGEARKRVVMPGEDAAPVQPSNPWLNRREGSNASQAWSAPTARPESAPATEPIAAYQAPPTEAPAASPEDSPQSTGRTLPKFSRPSMGGRASADSGSSRTRLYLLGAGVLLLVLIMIMLM